MNLASRRGGAGARRLRLVDDPAVVPRTRQHDDMRMGVQGDPTKATAAWGEKFFKAMVAGLVALVRKLEAGRGAGP